MSYTKVIRRGASPMAALKDVYQWGKRTGVHKITLLSQTYEKPTIRRNRIAEERAYYAKWFYLKYATEMIKYSLNNHLLLAPPVDHEDEQRLTSLRDKGFLSYAEAKEKLAQVEEDVREAEEALKMMDLFNPITATKRVSSRSLFTPASRIVEDVCKNKGAVPPLPVLKKQLEKRGWNSEETAALWVQLMEWRDLRLERQKLKDILAAHEGRAASWAEGYSEEDLQKLSLGGMKRNLVSSERRGAV